MPNRFSFDGKVAAAPELRRHGDVSVCKFTLIRNEYAGTDGASGEKQTRKVAVPFAAFGGMAETLAAKLLTGDQLIVEASIRNNHYNDGERDIYGYDFEIQNFDFGAPGPASRERFAAKAAAKSAPGD